MMLGLGGFLIGSTALADVAVMPATTTNVTSGDAEAIGVLLADAYAAKSGERTIDPTASGPVLREKGEAGAAASALQANEYIAVRIVKLNKRYSISATRYTLQGAVVHSARITVASLDDVAPATDRLARALHDRTDVEESMTLDNITEAESKAPTRIKTETIAGVKSGVTYAVASGERFSPMATVTYDGRHEGSSYFVEWGAGFTVPSDSSGKKLEYGGLHLEFGASYYLTQTDISPYLGAGILPRILSSGISVAPYAQGGVMFLRSSSTRLYTDFRIAQHVLPQDFGYDYSSATGESEEKNDLYPTEFTLSFGVGW